MEGQEAGGGREGKREDVRLLRKIAGMETNKKRKICKKNEFEKVV